MATKKHPQRRSGATPHSGDRAGQNLATMLTELIRRLDMLTRAARTDPLTQRFALDELAAAATAAAGELEEHRRELFAAIEIDRAHVPLAGTYPTGDLWTGPQRPRYLTGLARRAADDASPTTYAARLADACLAAELDPACPQTAADGGPCHGQRVRLAGRRRAESCWTHLTPARKAQIRDQREHAVSSQDCRTCDAPAAAPCRDPAGKVTQPHTARLNADAPPDRPTVG